MRGALLHEAGKPMEIAPDVEIVDPGPGQVIVDVKHCGLCHSDLHFIDGSMPGPSPLLLGHEAAGVVAEVGPGVTALAPGDHVMLTPVAPCNRCYWCVRGEHSLCGVNSQSIATHALADGTTGLSRQGQVVYRAMGVGGFADQVITYDTGAVKIPNDVDLGIVSVIGCAVQTGVGAVLNIAQVEEGATVLVMGAGGIGVSVIQGARLAGASQIIVSDPNGERRAMTERFGATAVLDPTDVDVVGECQRLTGGIGVDYAFDAVGAAPLVETGFNATRMGGTIVEVGAAPLDATLAGISAVALMFSQKSIRGCLLGGVNSLRDIPRLVELYRAGRLDLEAMVTRHRPLDEVNEAADDLANGRGLRTVLDM